MTTPRTPENPLDRELARSTIMARVSATDKRIADPHGMRTHQVDL